MAMMDGMEFLLMEYDTPRALHSLSVCNIAMCYAIFFSHYYLLLYLLIPFPPLVIVL